MPPPDAGTYIWDPETGKYYDRDGNLMEGMEQYYDPSMDPYSDAHYDETTGQYYDSEGNPLPPPPDGEFDRYMDGMNSTTDPNYDPNEI